MMLALGLSHVAFIMLRYVPSTHFSVEISSWMGAKFCQKHFLHLLRWSHGFYSSVCWCNCTSLIDLRILKTPYIWDESHYHGLWSFQGIVGFRLLVFCWRFLYLCSSMIWDCNFLFFVLSLPGFIISSKFSFFWNFLEQFHKDRH